MGAAAANLERQPAVLGEEPYSIAITLRKNDSRSGGLERHHSRHGLERAFFAQGRARHFQRVVFSATRRRGLKKNILSHLMPGTGEIHRRGSSNNW